MALGTKTESFRILRHSNVGFFSLSSQAEILRLASISTAEIEANV